MTIYKPCIYICMSLILMKVTKIQSLKMRYCNRGYCYTKNEALSPDLDSSLSNRQLKRTGFDFCTDGEGQLLDCELLEIMGTEDYMPIQDTKNPKAADWTWKKLSSQFNSKSKMKGEIHPSHIPWEKEPKKGHCYDYDAGHSFDCNLIKILDGSLVLVEDLRHDGTVFIAQPKTGFTTRKETNYEPHLEPVHTPDVLCGSNIDPIEDLRTNVEMNLAGV